MWTCSRLFASIRFANMGRNMGSGMRSLHRLSATKVTNLKQPGYYADGGNLYLRVAPGGTKGWIFRFAIAGRTRDAGLTPIPRSPL